MYIRTSTPTGELRAQKYGASGVLCSPGNALHVVASAAHLKLLWNAGPTLQSNSSVSRSCCRRSAR